MTKFMCRLPGRRLDHGNNFAINPCNIHSDIDWLYSKYILELIIDCINVGNYNIVLTYSKTMIIIWYQNPTFPSWGWDHSRQSYLWTRGNTWMWNSDQTSGDDKRIYDHIVISCENELTDEAWYSTAWDDSHMTRVLLLRDELEKSPPRGLRKRNHVQWQSLLNSTTTVNQNVKASYFQ